MSYITQDELIKRFGENELIQLTDREHLGDINTEVLNEAIADAAATVESYLQQQYTLPLDQALIDASPLKRIAGDIVRYFLFENGADEEVEKRYRDAIAWLRDIAAGKATLGSQDTNAANQNRITTGCGVSNFDWEAY